MARRIDEDPLEEAGLIQLHNYRKHPTNNNYYIFFYKDVNVAEEFEVLINQANISFEKDPPNSEDFRTYYAIEKDSFEVAKQLNFLAFGKKRKPMIPNNIGRYSLVIFFILIVSLAIVSLIKS